MFVVVLAVDAKHLELSKSPGLPVDRVRLAGEGLMS